MFGFKAKNWSSYGQFPELPQYLVDKSESIRPAVFQELPASPQSSFYEAHPHQRQGERLCTLWIVKRRQRRQWKLAAKTRRSAFSTEGHALWTGSQVVGGHVSSGIQKPSVSIAEPQDRKSVSLLGRVGAFKREEARLLSALFRRFNMQGTRGACTWQGSGFQIQTLRWENAEGDFLWAHFQLIPNHFTKHFIGPKVLMKTSVVLVIFLCTSAAAPDMQRLQDPADREGGSKPMMRTLAAGGWWRSTWPQCSSVHWAPRRRPLRSAEEYHTTLLKALLLKSSPHRAYIMCPFERRVSWCRLITHSLKTWDASHSQPIVCKFYWEITGNKWMCASQADEVKINNK